MGLFDKIKKELSRTGRRIEKEINRAADDVSDIIGDTFDSAVKIITGSSGSSSSDSDYASLNGSANSTIDSGAGVLLNKASATVNIPIVYGQRRIGITRVLLHTQGDTNKDLYSVGVLCEGPIAGISDIEINDDTIETWGGGSYSISDGSRLSLTSDVSFCAHFGSWLQTADSFFVSNLGSLWTSSHKLSGVAYTATKYTYNSEKIASLPTQTSVISGRLLYDPRTGNTAYSTNAALVILDYMRNSVYGESVTSDDEIDFDSFKVAADIADRTAETFTGSGVNYKPIDINAVISTATSRLDNMNALLAHAHASLPYSQGKYRIVIRSTASSSFEFTDDNIVGDISVSSAGASDKYNRVTVTFIDPELNWSENTVIYPTDDSEYQQLLAQDNGIEKHPDITTEMITNKYQALDYARRYLYESRKSLSISFSALPSARKVLPGQVVELNTSNLGAFLFTVTKRSITADGEYNFTLKEYDPSIYSWINQSEISSGETPALPSIYNLSAPALLTFTKAEYNTEYQGVLSWVESNSAFVTRYKVDVYNTVSGVLAWSNVVTSNNIQIPNFPTGTYRADVKGLSEISGTETASILWNSNIPSLPIVQGLVQFGAFASDLTLKWTAVSAQAIFRVYRVKVVVDGEADLYISTVDESVTITNAQFSELGYPRYFKVYVSAVNVAFVDGPAALISITRDMPAVSGVEITPSADNVKLDLASTSNSSGVIVWLSDSDPVEMTDENQKYKGESLSITLDGLLAQSRYYIAVAAYDEFSVGYAAYYSVTTLKDTLGDTINYLSSLNVTQEISNLEEAALLNSLRMGKNQRDILEIKQALFE